MKCVSVVQSVGELMAYNDVPVINWVSLQQTIKKKDVVNTYIRAMTPLVSLGKYKSEMAHGAQLFHVSVAT